MTNYIILIFCVLVLLSYLFDITSKYSKIPGGILLIALGILVQVIVGAMGFEIANMEPVLPVLGTLGLILIVMDASLDLKLEPGKKRMILKSVSSAFILFVFFVVVLSFIMVRFMGFPLIDTLLNVIPVGIISSTVAISSAGNLKAEQKEFIVYESSFSDIIGILLFDFILINQGSILRGLVNFTFSGLLTIVIAVILTSGLAILMHKTRYHINYVIIMTAVVLVYVLAKLLYLPALFLVLVFGLALSNNRLAENTIVEKYVDFEKFRKDLNSFKTILGELTFLVRSFFFIMFGYYTKIRGLINISNVLTGLLIIAIIFFLRWLFFKLVLKMPATPLAYFAPRGLITILLFLSIPAEFRLPVISEEVITLVILFSIIILTFGNMLPNKKIPKPQVEPGLEATDIIQPPENNIIT
jgi:Kef-type K+ transport system membrane component KefB